MDRWVLLLVLSQTQHGKALRGRPRPVVWVSGWVGGWVGWVGWVGGIGLGCVGGSFSSFFFFFSLLYLPPPQT